MVAVGDLVGLNLDTARNVALVVAVTAIVLAVIGAWLLKAIFSKLVTAVVLFALAGVVWTQRASLDECVADVRESVGLVTPDDATCTFFGRDVAITGHRDG